MPLGNKSQVSSTVSPLRRNESIGQTGSFVIRFTGLLVPVTIEGGLLPAEHLPLTSRVQDETAFVFLLSSCSRPQRRQPFSFVQTLFLQSRLFVSLCPLWCD